ncbi:MAG TPA: hypothetical protein EYN66_19960, partial [Myxococcales bacterium]|nr:hypothetical protein [Myxococcales bacterium]
MSRGVCYLVLALCSVSAPAFAQGTGSKAVPGTLKVGSAMEDSTGKTMVFIPSGEFIMGDSRGPDSDEQPPHQIKLTRSIWMDQHDVTRGEYKACVKA